MHERNCLSYWFPRLQSAGVPVPRTALVKTGVNLMLACHGEPADGPKPEAEFCEFIEELSEAAIRISPSGPWFLRTGQGSGKHNWNHCCHVTALRDLARHVGALVEWSETVDFFGLPWDVWAVREMLPTDPVAVLPAYGDMPLVPELRYFVADGAVRCRHYYWPAKAVAEGYHAEPEDFAAILLRSRCLPGGESQLNQADALAGLVARSFAADGTWSVDVLPTRRGLFVTDMAGADRSFHWPGCPNATPARAALT